MKAIDPGDLLLLGFVIAVVGQIVVAFRHSDGRISAIIAVMRDDISRDARGVRLKRQRQQIEHEADVLLAIFRNAGRLGKIRRGRGEPLDRKSVV